MYPCRRRASTSRPTTRTPLDRRLRWAELFRRVFDADVLHCECFEEHRDWCER